MCNILGSNDSVFLPLICVVLPSSPPRPISLIILSSTSPHPSAAIPFVDVQSRLGINLNGWLLLQSGQQPNKRAARCHAFEKEWVECSHGIGQTRAKKECQLEFEDFYECMHRQKTHQRLHAIRQQRDKMVKEGTYTPPSCHSGKPDQTP